MANVLQADASAASAWVSKDLGAPQSDIWFTFGLAFRNAALAFWRDSLTLSTFLSLEDTPLSQWEIFYLDAAAGEWKTSFVSGDVPTPEAQVWRLVEFHYEAGVQTELFIDEESLGTGLGAAALIQYVRFGQIDTFGGSSGAFIRDVKIGTTRGGTDIFADDFSSGNLSAWDTTSGDVSVIPEPTLVPNTQVFGGSRFYEAPPWRFVVSNLDDEIQTFLDRLGFDRAITVTRAAARVMTVRVPSDSPEVNIPAPPPDDEPFVAEGIRLLSCFRREAPGDDAAPWVIRARGLILGLDDDADTDHATSTVTAYDPWKYLYRRPILDPATGLIPTGSGYSYPALVRASEIIVDQLNAAYTFGGSIFTDFGQTPFYTGTIENTEPLPDGGDGLAITFPVGTTLGEMLDTLVATGTCDVVFDPIYDLADRPGFLCELSVYESAGSFRPNAIFGWDRWPRSSVELTRQTDGTARANQVQMFAGAGGPPVPREDDAASLARFGQYWALQYLPGVPSLAGAHTIAQRQLALLREGAYTFSLSPAAERAPRLFEEYREADTVPVYASPRFRAPIAGTEVRVESIPIVIGDDQLERVQSMLVSFSPDTGS